MKGLVVILAGAPVGVFRFLWDWPTSSTLSPSMPSKESGLCPEAVSTLPGSEDLGGCLVPSSLPVLP